MEVSKHLACACLSVLTFPHLDTGIPPDFNLMVILMSFTKLTAAGPFCLRIQHIILASEVPPSCSRCRAPPEVSTFLAGGSLTAFYKSKSAAPDICPMAVGKSLRCFVGKCICAAVKTKAAETFQLSRALLEQ